MKLKIAHHDLLRHGSEIELEDEARSSIYWVVLMIGYCTAVHY